MVPEAITGSHGERLGDEIIALRAELLVRVAEIARLQGERCLEKESQQLSNKDRRRPPDSVAPPDGKRPSEELIALRAELIARTAEVARLQGELSLEKERLKLRIGDMQATICEPERAPVERGEKVDSPSPSEAERVSPEVSARFQGT